MKYDEAEAVGRFIAPCLEALDYLRQRVSRPALLHSVG